MIDKVYVGFRPGDRGSQAVTVTVIENGNPRPLPLRLDLQNYSLNGFDWGYSGNRPAQLALAILADLTGRDDYALKHHHWFKLEVIAGLPRYGWKLTAGQIERWISQHHPIPGSTPYL